MTHRSGSSSPSPLSACCLETAILARRAGHVCGLAVKQSVVFEASTAEWDDYARKGRLSRFGRALEEAGLFDPVDTVPDPKVAVDFTNLILNVTSGCNFQCAYCFQGQARSRHMSIEIARRALKMAAHLFNRARTNVTFFGGEPLLRFKQIKAIVELADRLLGDRKVTFSVTTNGTLITDSVAEFFHRREFTVVISLDSFSEVNALTRIPKALTAGEAYRRIWNSLEKIISLGIQVRCNLVVTRHNISRLAEFVAHLLEAGVSEVSLSLVADPIHALTEQAIELLIDQERKMLLAWDGIETLRIEPISTIIRLLRSHTVNLYRCGFGRLRLNVQPDGSITPCQRVTSPIGSVDRGISEDYVKWVALDSVEHRVECQSCSFRYLCGGNCYHESLAFHGNMAEPFRPYCYHHAMLVRASAARLVEIAAPTAVYRAIKFY